MSYSLKKALMALALITPVMSIAYADPMLSTGGYNQQLRTEEMMRMLDDNGDHKVTQAEFKKYYNALFDNLNKDTDDSLDAKEWVGTTKDNKISIATGGYSSELRNIKMMDAMDSDADHLVTRQEFIAYHEGIFKQMDTKGQGVVDAQDWLRKQTNN
ncbi:MAG TPA: calcium-binding protein [Methylophilaceae bacterium]|nr:calcium-binding protein [Methylophilaceae bacterium]